jgi:hypothetical protein
MKNLPHSPELSELLNVENELCVSLICPLSEQPSLKRMDRVAIDHAIEKLRKLLENSQDTAIVSELITRLKGMEENLSRITGAKGIGVFISRSVFRVVTFPFEVTEKVHAGLSFEVRDVLYRDQLNVNYHVLSLTLDRVRLFHGHGPSITEVEDDNFPAVFSEPESEYHELEVSDQNLAATTRREKALTMESPHAFLNGIDKKLGLYMNNQQPLLLAGVQKELAAFEKTTSRSAQVKGKIPGSYNGYNLQELQAKSWECIQHHMLDEEDRLISSLNELFGRELVSIGLQDVWRNARLGKGNVLVVERDFAQPAFVTGDGYQVWLSPPAEDHELLSDAVDDLIETVVKMDGRVVFVGNGKLREFNGVAMIHRY